MSHEVTGGCLCGQVRYRATLPTRELVVCWCSQCLRQNSGPLVSVRPAEAAEISGPVAGFRASGFATRGFCPHCGSTLTYRHESDPEELDITVSSLDHPERVAPAGHIWWEHHLPWGSPAAQQELPIYQRSEA